MTTALIASRTPGASVSPPPQQDCGDGFEENDEIESEAPAADVVEIELHLLMERDVAPAADLPDTGESRGDVEAAPIRERVLRDLGDSGWARANQGHIPMDDAPELRAIRRC